MSFPSARYLHRSDQPHAGPHRPLSQGDVFVDIPLVGAAQRDLKQAGTWRPTKPRTGPKALGLFVTHPCASRSQATYELAEFVSIAPVVKCPSATITPRRTRGVASFNDLAGGWPVAEKSLHRPANITVP